MNIPAIRNTIAKTFGFFICAAFPAAIVGNMYENNIISDIKSEVLSKDSLRYKRIEKNTKNLDIITRKKIWAKELADINDSIKIESTAKKAYFEGGQMVKDSVNR